MSRDLAAEHQADLVAAELAALRDLRDAALRLGNLLMRAGNPNYTVTEEEKPFLLVAFDAEGMGPFVVPVPELTGNLGRLARNAKALEVAR
jgi:hypothetical protein